MSFSILIFFWCIHAMHSPSLSPWSCTSLWPTPSHPYFDEQFQKKRLISQLRFYLDYKLDESYTPKKLYIRHGTTFHDLRDFHTLELEEPTGWVKVDMVAPNGDQELRTNFVQVCILAMHQNGRDTHVRQVQVYGPRKADRGPYGETFPEFADPALEQFSKIR